MNMKVDELYQILNLKALDLLSLEYDEETILDKLFDQIDSLYLDDKIQEELYNSCNYKAIESIITNARLTLTNIGV